LAPPITWPVSTITVCIAGVAAQDLFGFSRPEAGYSDHAQIIELVEGLSEAESLELRNAAYARAREIIKNQKSEVERLAELRPFNKKFRRVPVQRPAQQPLDDSAGDLVRAE